MCEFNFNGEQVILLAPFCIKFTVYWRPPFSRYSIALQVTMLDLRGIIMVILAGLFSLITLYVLFAPYGVLLFHDQMEIIHDYFCKRYASNNNLNTMTTTLYLKLWARVLLGKIKPSIQKSFFIYSSPKMALQQTIRTLIKYKTDLEKYYVNFLQLSLYNVASYNDY